jgi:hypothetical protein
MSSNPTAARWRGWAGPAIVALALLGSLTSLSNGFAFDDLAIIAQDRRLHRLDQPSRFFTQAYWAPRSRPALYRPLTSLAFALEWRLGNGAAWPYHVVNVLLYALVCLAVFRLAVPILGPVGGWWSAALFAVHPVHVEAVANSVGQSELWAALAVILAVGHYVRARRNRTITPRDIALLGGLYAIGCLFKEHAIVLPALLLAAEVTVLGRSFADVFRGELRVLWLVLGLTAVLFWGVHASVVGNVAGDFPSPAFWGMSHRDRVLTMLGVVPEWFRLLFFPARLKVEYVPQEIPLATTFGWPQLLGTGLLLGAGAAAFHFRRRKPVVTFAALWVAVTLFPVSNLLVPSGVLLAERTLFLPSVGAALALGAGISWIWDRAAAWTIVRRKIALGLGAAVLTAGVVHSALRQPVWRNNDSFFDQMLVDAPKSYRSHWIRGLRLFEKRDAAGGDKEFATALDLFPNDPALLAQVADRYRSSGRCDQAVPLYRQSLVIEARKSYLRRRMIECLFKADRLDEAREEVSRALVTHAPGARRDSIWVDSLIRLRSKP